MQLQSAIAQSLGAEWTERIAAQLTRAGVTASDVVAMMLANRVELPIVTMAACRIGASVTPVNPALKTAEALCQIGDAAAQLVIHDTIDADLSGQPTLHVDLAWPMLVLSTGMGICNAPSTTA